MRPLTPHLIQAALLLASPVTFWVLAHLLRPLGTRAISRETKQRLADYIAAPAFEHDLFSENSARSRTRTLRFLRSRLRIDASLAATALTIALLLGVWSFVIGTPHQIWAAPYLATMHLVIAWPFIDGWMHGKDVYLRALADTQRQ